MNKILELIILGILAYTMIKVLEEIKKEMQKWI